MLLSETTGVRMQQTSINSGNLSIRIQGLDGRYTQLLKDGFPLYSGFAGGLSIMQIPPLDLKQVELIKGSNSTLFGGGAIAGLVNMITIKPEEKPELNIMIDQTSALGTTGNLFYAQKYGKTGLTVYGSAQHQKAYDPDNDGFSNMPKSQSLSLNPKLYLFLKPRTNLSLGFNLSRDNRTGGDMKVIKGVMNDKHNFSEKNSSNRYSVFLNFNNSTDERIFSIKNSVSYFYRKLQIPDYTFAGNQLSSFSEILLNLNRNEKSDWQFGANFYTESFIEEKIDSFHVRDYTNNTVGGFIQNTANFSSFIALESGLRTDYDFEHGVFFLPRVSILFKPSRKLTSRIGGAFGYKLPTIFTEDAEKIYFKEIAPIVASNMKPEKSLGLNFDILYKTFFFQKFTFSVNQLFFITRLRNSLVLREDSVQNRYFYENASGDILSSGFETNIKLTYKDFKLYFNYALVNTDLKYNNINKQKPLTPKHNAGFVIFYEIEEKWSAGYELYYTGSQFDEMYDKKPDYWVMGVMLMRKFERLSIYVNFENFANTIQTKYEPLVLPPLDNPTFPDIWAPSDGFVFNAGLKIIIL
jgi:iron complex outermembrane receptor protein